MRAHERLYQDNNAFLRSMRSAVITTICLAVPLAVGLRYLSLVTLKCEYLSSFSILSADLVYT